ncbi:MULTISPECIES: DUF3097 family protein [Micrococcus]|uniref:DUF3097 domain-containing protein n=1 Tax=Micrococcus aloeverae TaxID=1391911 RepID=A0ABR6DVU9_9MICC|nr:MULTISPECIES: DUF3097 family protein [Micrococcus]EZP48455.1 hypothetical protein BW35_00036 [Micrococcus luteus]KYK07023.1 hypothetical protein AUV08_04910 [Micrococcus sp. CH7]KZE65665.1 hypothetical protein AWM60_10705 [Micrococcus aloeverae]MBA9080419.1 hypothetical protein [Micrococcus aloeverae]MCV7478357.1 DUF3097 domain-containing protein [Micrococcus luteus]
MDWSSWGPAGHDDLTRRPARTVPDVPAAPGTVVEDVASGFTGAVIGIERSGGVHVVVLEDHRGVRRGFPLGGGFWIDGEPVTLVPPTAAAPAAPARTASGSRRVEGARARTARASRIWVEGVHDAELVEKVWGEDLRLEGIVVEPLHGVDDLAGAIRTFAPGPRRRLGILVDHLVTGSKEERLAAEAMRVPGAAGNVLILGHPYVDVWQVIKPSVLGIPAWPVVPKGQDWKTGILRGLGWPHGSKEATGLGWKRLLSHVTTYADLEPSLLGRVEELIDFLTAAPEH